VTEDRTTRTASEYLDLIAPLLGLTDAIRRDGAECETAQLPARPAQFGQLARPLSPSVASALQAAGAGRLYSHQVAAIDAVLNGNHVVVATPTASGKTLCFNVPVMERLAADPLARALYLYPTKALAQDQLGKWEALVKGAVPAIPNALAAVFDGDTPLGQRAAIRRRARVLISNPDMLHLGILPNHQMRAQFLRHLAVVVIDEAHVYRGVFGTQVAGVLRRLRRLCAMYQGDGRPGPLFIGATATIGNPEEHFELLTGVRPIVIGGDGAPHGSRQMVLWNPPFVDRESGGRLSTHRESARILARLVESGVRTIAFARARVVAELILRYSREILNKTEPELAARVASYRAGYLAEDRRRIEQDLFSGKLSAVAATSALELGIDVGDLDASLLDGFPGTVASFWQQAGRAGRGEHDALTVLIGSSNPLDQYYLRHPQALLGQRPQQRALLDPENHYVLRQQLLCAAFEAPLELSDPAGQEESVDRTLFGAGAEAPLAELVEEGQVRRMGARWIYAGTRFPAADVSLRNADGRRVVVLDMAHDGSVLEELDAASAPARVFPGAIYLHQGESYLVQKLDLISAEAYVTPVSVQYHTEVREVSEVRVVRSLRHRLFPSGAAYLGRLRVRSQVVGFRRVESGGGAAVEEEPLEFPPTEYETVGMWWDIPPELPGELAADGLDYLGAIHAAEHAAIGMLPLFAMCDRWDIGGLSTPRNSDTDQAQIFIYDGYPGGIGLAERGFDLLPQLWRATLEAITRCPCQEGCPSCVQSPKCGSFNTPLDKRGAARVIERLSLGAA
jgi:DEAD/DEAH box helicase domain-containing protein